LVRGGAQVPPRDPRARTHSLPARHRRARLLRPARLPATGRQRRSTDGSSASAAPLSASATSQELHREESARSRRTQSPTTPSIAMSSKGRSELRWVYERWRLLWRNILAPLVDIRCGIRCSRCCCGLASCRVAIFAAWRCAASSPTRFCMGVCDRARRGRSHGIPCESDQITAPPPTIRCRSGCNILCAHCAVRTWRGYEICRHHVDFDLDWSHCVGRDPSVNTDRVRCAQEGSGASSVELPSNSTSNDRRYVHHCRLVSRQEPNVNLHFRRFCL